MCRIENATQPDIEVREEKKVEETESQWCVNISYNHHVYLLKPAGKPAIVFINSYTHVYFTSLQFCLVFVSCGDK